MKGNDLENNKILWIFINILDDSGFNFLQVILKSNSLSINKNNHINNINVHNEIKHCKKTLVPKN